MAILVAWHRCSGGQFLRRGFNERQAGRQETDCQPEIFSIFSEIFSMRDRQADRRQIVGQKYFQTSTADDDDQLRRWEKYLAVTAVTFVES